MGRSKSTTTVGRSSVTPCKHFLLHKLLGQEAGVMAHGVQQLDGCERAFWLDLTAGNGEPMNIEKPDPLTCGSAIFAYHAQYLANESNGVLRELEVHASEQNKKTYLQLTNNMEKLWWPLYPRAKEFTNLHHSKAEELNLPEFRNTDAVFMYNDPNLIAHWSLAPNIINNMTMYTRTLTTLGCNVGGYKREIAKNPELADKWRNNIEKLLTMQRHPAVLLAVGDMSQWAYLITTPKNWVGSTMKTCESAWDDARKKSPEFRELIKNKRPRIVSTEEPQKFDNLLDELLLTKDQAIEKGLIQEELF